MKLGSLFDGSGGFPLAGYLCGIIPAFAAEIEPYPIAVTKSRFSTMIHYGDVSKISGAEVEPVDIITFGSPCQDLSVAGKRAGLKHEENGDDQTTRSGLFMEAIRIIKEMRQATNGKYPTFALWENVPGAFSSNKGEDFRIVLEEFIKIVEPEATLPPADKKGWPYADCYLGNGWSIAYRTFDAQYWGVPQRRRRIYLVADFRGERAGKILFEREGLRGHTTQSRTKRKGAAEITERSFITNDRTKSDGILTFEPGIASREGGHMYEGVAGTIRANAGDNQLAVAYMTDKHILDDQGGSSINTRQDGKSPTLRAEAHGNLPCIVTAAGFCPEQSAKTRGIGYEKEKSPTLRAEAVPGVTQVVAVATQQGGAEITQNGICPTVTAAAGMSGNNQPWICKKKESVCYGISSYDSNGMKSNNPRSGIYKAQTSRTIDLNGGNPACNQGGIMVVEKLNNRRTIAIEGNGSRPSHRGDGYKESDVMYTLNTIERPAVAYWDGTQTIGTLTANNAGGNQRMPDKENFNCVVETYGIDRAAFNQGQNAKFGFSIKEEIQPTMTAEGPGAVASNYIVRRLTPTECARLQGFPDKWGHPDKKENLTDEEYQFWQNVRNTHAAINNKTTKEYTKEQILKWYNKLHTDSAEYKMWGNGIALPNALYVMQGIAKALRESKQN